VGTQIERIEDRFQRERAFGAAYTAFGGLAVLLASVGLFALMSYTVVRRKNEIAIRMALGAQRLDVHSQVLGESMRMVLAAIVIGLATALVAGRLVAVFLFGVPATDMASMTSAVAIMLAVSAFAAYLPARWASRVDPIAALRRE
jgi:ABC-type antimicrobial peptide transport system permease subunit